MSRLIVKNLLNGMKAERFWQLFAAFSTLTDCSLKFTKDGKFRKFGFIGFKSEEEAQAALNHFIRSFIDTSRITVEFCKSFGDPTKPRAWSKHAQKPSQPKQLSQDSVPPDTKKDHSKKKVPSELEKLKEDGDFQEFLSVHQNRAQVATWANDALDTEPPKGKNKPASDYLNFDSDSGQESEEEQEGYIFVDLSSEEEVKKALKCNREYMVPPRPSVLGVGSSWCLWCSPTEERVPHHPSRATGRGPRATRNRITALHGVQVCGVQEAGAGPESPQAAPGSCCGWSQAGSADLRTGHYASLTPTWKKHPRMPTTSKILVRNIPFQANQREIRELFRPSWRGGMATGA